MWLCANRNQLTLVRSHYLTALVVSIQIGFGPTLATASGLLWTHPSMLVCQSVCFMGRLVTHEEAWFKHRGVAHCSAAGEQKEHACAFILGTSALSGINDSKVLEIQFFASTIPQPALTLYGG